MYRVYDEICGLEGRREVELFVYLKEIYVNQQEVSFRENPKKGGNSAKILDFAIKNNFCDRSFAWIDEDVDLGEEFREKLAQCWNLNEKDSQAILSCLLRELQSRFNSKNKKPVLIVSQPVCVESLILRILGKQPKYAIYDPENREQQIQDLKNALDGVFGNEKPLDYYRKNLSKELLEERRKEMPELDLLIKMISTD